MGSKMVRNLRQDGHTLMVFDSNQDAMNLVCGDGVDPAVCDSAVELFLAYLIFV